MTNQQEQMFKEQFIEQEFSKVWLEKLKSRNFDDKDLKRYCLDKAWADAIIYVRKQNRDEDSGILENGASVKNMIYKCIDNYSCKQDFDEWHDKICRKQKFGMRYGVWQKYINMCFKYLYCINDKLSSPLSIDFTKCHIPLDGNTLFWCRKKGITKITAWNSIGRKDYKDIRDGVKNVIQESPDLSGALQLDFIVWRIKKICDVLLSIKNLKDDLKGLENYHDWFESCGFNISDNEETRNLLTEMDILKSYVCKSKRH